MGRLARGSERLVAPPRPRAHGLRPHRPALASPAVARAARAKHDRSRRRSSSVSPTARPPGSSSASSTRRRSTPSRTRCCAGRCRTRRCNRFYAQLPRELDSERSRTRISTRDRVRPPLSRRRARVRGEARSHRAPGGGAQVFAGRRPRGLPAGRGGVRGRIPSAAARGRVRLGPRGPGVPARAFAR